MVLLVLFGMPETIVLMWEIGNPRTLCTIAEPNLILTEEFANLLVYLVAIKEFYCSFGLYGNWRTTYLISKNHVQILKSHTSPRGSLF